MHLYISVFVIAGVIAGARKKNGIIFARSCVDVKCWGDITKKRRGRGREAKCKNSYALKRVKRSHRNAEMK